jgi:hypothetical protein
MRIKASVFVFVLLIFGVQNSYSQFSVSFTPFDKAHYVGETDTIGIYEVTAFWDCPFIFQGYPYRPNSAFSYEVLSDGTSQKNQYRVYVFYTPRSTASLLDTVILYFLMESVANSCYGRVDSLRLLTSAEGTSDSTVRILPSYQQSTLRADTAKNKWTGTAQIILNNKIDFPTQFSNWKIIADSNIISVTAAHKGIPTSTYNATAFETQIPIDFELSLSHGPIYDTMFTNVILETQVTSKFFNSTQQNTIGLTILPAPYKFHGSIDSSSLHFTNDPGTHDQKIIRLHLDPTTKRYSYSPLSHPFSLKENIIDSSAREIAINCDPKSGGNYRELLKINLIVKDFNGDERKDSLSAILTESATTDKDSAFWIPVIKAEMTARKILGLHKGEILVSNDTMLFHSIDTGKSWTSAYFPEQSMFGVQFVADDQKNIYFIEGLPVNGYYSSTIYKSSTFGTTWYPENKGLQWNYGGSADANLFPLSLSIDLNNTLYIDCHGYINDLFWHRGTLLAGSFQSTDRGLTWVGGADVGYYEPPVHYYFFDSTNVRVTLYNGYCNNSNFNDTLKTITFSAVNDYILPTKNKGIFRSTDSGRSWTKLGLDLPDIRAIATSPSGEIFIASYGNGVFRSTDNGKNWEGINGGLNTKKVNDIIAVPGEPLYLATEDSWVWESQWIVSKSLSSPVLTKTTSNITFDIFPNPAQSVVTINYALPDNISAKIALYDILGKKLPLPEINNEINGKGSLNIDLSILPANMYFSTLQTSTGIITKKILRY